MSEKSAQNKAGVRRELNVEAMNRDGEILTLGALKKVTSSKANRIWLWVLFLLYPPGHSHL